MYTSLFLLALSAVPVGVEPERNDVNWQMNYLEASASGCEAGKPLAIFFGPGPWGWQKVTGDVAFSQEIIDLLNSEYLPVYVNTGRGSGKTWADQFELPDGIGLVISDAGCAVQAFHHAGHLDSDDLLRYLRRYADDGRTVRTTETAATEQVSYERLNVTPAPAAPAVPQYQRTVPVYSGRGC
jgi:hypothetical protein